MTRASWRLNSKKSHELAAKARVTLTSRAVLDHWKIPEDAEIVKGKGRSYKVGKHRVFRLVLRVNGAENAFTLTNGDQASLKPIFDTHYGDMVVSNPPSALYVEQGPFLVESFPNDWKLSGLKAALDPQHFLRLLVASSCVGASDAEDLSVTATVFRYIPQRRCLINYEIRGASLSQDLVGKLFSSAEGASRSFDTLKFMGENEATADAAPKPIAFDRKTNLVVMERIEGRQLSALLDEVDTNQARESAIEYAADLLAQIHSLKFGDGGTPSLISSGESIKKLHAQIPDRGAALAADIQTALEKLELLADRTGPLPDLPSLIHGDFNPRQVLLTADRARAVDFDGSGPGDPAADVGRFCSSLRARAIEVDDPQCRDLATYFVQRYELATGGPISRRARYYEALGLLYRARLLSESSKSRTS